MLTNSDAKVLRQRLRDELVLRVRNDEDPSFFATLSALPPPRPRQPDLRAIAAIKAATSEFLDHTRPLRLVPTPTSGMFMRVSHQPDFLAGLNTLGPVLLLGSMATAERPVLFTSIDYVTTSSKRVMRAEVPMGLSHRAEIRPRLKDSQTAFLPMLPSPKPPEIDRWLITIRNSVAATARELRGLGCATRTRAEAMRMMSDLRDLWQDLALRSSSWSAFSTMMNVSLATALLPGRLSAMLGHRYLALADLHRSHLTSSPETMRAAIAGGRKWWWVCRRCRSKVDIEWYTESGRATGLCRRCGLILDDWVDQTECTSDGFPRFIPRVTADVALELMLAPGVVHASYGGSLGHLYHTRSLLAGSHAKLPPELVWDPTGLLRNTAEGVPAGSGANLLATGKAPLLLFYLLFDSSALTFDLWNGSRPGPYGNQAPIVHLRGKTG